MFPELKKYDSQKPSEHGIMLQCPRCDGRINITAFQANSKDYTSFYCPSCRTSQVPRQDWYFVKRQQHELSWLMSREDVDQENTRERTNNMTECFDGNDDLQITVTIGDELAVSLRANDIFGECFNLAAVPGICDALNKLFVDTLNSGPEFTVRTRFIAE